MPGPFSQWLKLLTPRTRSKAANQLYLSLVAQSRQPIFYTDYGVPDTVDGRFDMMALHCFLVMNRMKDMGDEAAKISQVLFDEMFEDMDRGLRELGVGDTGVGRRVRAMAKAYLGRVDVYDQALAAEDPVPPLQEALERNLYRGVEVQADLVAKMAGYVLGEHQYLAGQPDDALLAGNVHFSSMAPQGA